MDFEEEGSFGYLLARYRTEARRSQQYLADCLGVSRSAVVKWEQKGILPKDRTRIEEVVRCLKLRDPQRDAMFKAALLPIPYLIRNLPYPRNPFFTARDQELERLREQLYQRNTAAIGQMQSISGLGGIGKTQLAVEYAYRHYDEYQYLLWARAESVETLTSSFTELAHLLDLPKKNAPDQEVMIQEVKSWLQRQRGWLLILDNADMPDLLPAFLPPTVGGHLLITTRAADLSAQIAGLPHPLIVETFSDEQGAHFLLHRSSLLAPNATLDQAETHTRQLAMEITHELGGLPLALDQVGAYLKATGSSLATYQHIYQQRRFQLLHNRRGVDHPEPAATTWDISFHKVEQQNPAAADLLRFCAFLAPDAIPEAILTEGAQHLGPILAPVAAEAYLLNEAVESLRAYSLITRDPQARVLTIHRLVQAVLRDSMPIETQKQWMQRTVFGVSAAGPNVQNVAQWGACEQWLPHALICTTWIEQAQLDREESSSLLHRAGYYLDDRGRYAEAEPLMQQALAINERQLGPQHPNTATSLNNLAELYRNQGKYVEAEPLYQRALAIRERMLGPVHPHTANSLNNLALLYYEQGRYAEAEPLLQRALHISEQQLGSEHPDTASSLNNLAGLYESQGKYVEAEPLYQRALAIRERQLGPAHPITASSLNNLAELYQNQGRYREAEPLYQRALTICEQQLGSAHPTTATSLNNLATLYLYQGRYGEAEPLLKRALAIREQQLGPAHPITGSSLNNLAELYRNQGRYGEAVPLCQRGLDISEQELGASHPDTASSLNNLAGFYRLQGRYGEAEPLYERALAIHEQELGASHPSTANSLNNLAELYSAQGRYEEAKPLYQRALVIFEQQLGFQHPATQTVRTNYIALLEATKQGNAS